MTLYLDIGTGQISPVPPSDGTRPVITKTITLPTSIQTIREALALAERFNPADLTSLDKMPILAITFA
jgi:hypothetical protein